MTQQSRFWIALGFLLTISAAIAMINLNEDWRAAFRDRFIPESREVIAKASGDLTGNGRQFTVLKVKTNNTIVIEVYENDKAANHTLFRARAVMPEHRDAQFSYQGGTTSLLLKNVSGGPGLDIISPGFDENLVPRMHVYKFNDSFGSIEQLSPDAIKL